ncbi:SusE domain-containing protein [Roseivirga pacifica]|nr:SusF/SusE family outer membrane protein [Roseivirga pacifica]MCO6359544.1 SusF/SusE family outer membrane protein [Roseivirga pacifica]MCO6366914.1 SusF/SusE family outer membrane protein [Roseivirga pacifica]MCO6370554.1 SusF/SusE family outer membrane protein [Roseivirga pacifica]MCO6374571.1 SusF/SusE family outer membrane protein [Roseivirga pacifica]MCO6379829.1 SusF/SusE family outer membrane protein [Roseivirga pacifica]
MKTIKTYMLAVLALFFVASCAEDDGLVFIATPSEEGVAFQNSFASNYLLSEETADNLAERFVWNEADFGAPVNVTYELHGSIDPTFATSEIVGSTAETNIGVTVSVLLDMAEELGLDDDPNTADMGNTGQVYFRLRAFVGAGQGEPTEMISEIEPLNIEVIERQPDGTCASIWAVGEATEDAGWDWSSPIEFTCENDVRSTHVSLINGTFRFFSTEGDWASGMNFPYYVSEGYTIDANFEDAADGDNNFRFIGTPGVYELVVDDVNKTITLNESQYYLVGEAIVQTGWDWANRPVMVEVDPYVYSVDVELTNGAFRFFTVDTDWGSGLNYPYFVDEGYTIDANFENAEDGDSNFSFIGTPGTYTLTVDTANKTITLN